MKHRKFAFANTYGSYQLTLICHLQKLISKSILYKYMKRSLQLAKSRAMGWLGQGLSPRQLGFTLALGFAVGCVPVLGVTTAICTVLALAFGLNMPAIQAANWLAMPFQIFLLVPFLRLGQWLFRRPAMGFSRSQILAELTRAPWQAMARMGGMWSHALLAWLVMAAPFCLLLMLALTFLLGRLPRMSAAQSGD
jgi:uncharacterized protein (DUF2062 family)